MMDTKPPIGKFVNNCETHNTGRQGATRMSSPATRYCYHCQRHHSSDEMRQITGKGSTRWRCVASIQAAKKDVAAREAFGKTISAINREDAKVRLTTRLQAERAAMAAGK